MEHVEETDLQTIRTAFVRTAPEHGPNIGLLHNSSPPTRPNLPEKQVWGN